MHLSIKEIEAMLPAGEKCALLDDVNIFLRYKLFPSYERKYIRNTSMNPLVDLVMIIESSSLPRKQPKPMT